MNPTPAIRLSFLRLYFERELARLEKHRFGDWAKKAMADCEERLKDITALEAEINPEGVSHG